MVGCHDGGHSKIRDREQNHSKTNNAQKGGKSDSRVDLNLKVMMVLVVDLGLGNCVEGTVWGQDIL